MTRRRRNSRSTKLLSRIKRSVARDNHGSEIKGPSDPPMIVQAPWWPLTVITATTANTIVTPLVVYNAIVAQIPDFKPPAANVELRLVSVRAWRKDGPIQLKVNNMVNGQMIQQLADLPAPMTYAHVGWKYGKTQQQVSHNMADTTLQLFDVNLRQAETKNACILYMHCMVKLTANTAAFTLDVIERFNRELVFDKDPSYEMV